MSDAACLSAKTGRLRHAMLLSLLMACALILAASLVYLFLADTQRFPIGTVKIVADYRHITRKQLELVLNDYMNASFFSLAIGRLHAKLLALEWSERVAIERIWPDMVKVTLVEKTPVAIWNGALMTDSGALFDGGVQAVDLSLAKLSGPLYQQMEVFKTYKSLNKIVTAYDFNIVSLQLRDNQAWDLVLSQGVRLHLGNRDLEQRVLRFCRAYPAVFANKLDLLNFVDLRYARGMVAQWKQLTRG